MQVIHLFASFSKVVSYIKYGSRAKSVDKNGKALKYCISGMVSVDVMVFEFPDIFATHYWAFETMLIGEANNL